MTRIPGNKFEAVLHVSKVVGAECTNRPVLLEAHLDNQIACAPIDGKRDSVLFPEFRNEGNGREAVFLLLDEGFNRMNLNMVYGESYKVPNGSNLFWEGVIIKCGGYKTILPSRKYWEGKYHSSLYFSITKDQYEKANSRI